MFSDEPRNLPPLACRKCWKSPPLCFCGEISPVETRTKLLILQHPKEVRSPLGTARLLSLSLNQCTHRVGLSWRSLAHAVGNSFGTVDSSEWAVLFVGNQKASKAARPGLMIQGKYGALVSLKKIRGLVILDGNWKQAKSLWWRNSWLLKLNRALLTPRSLSEYGKVRRQPRQNCVCSLEAASESFYFLQEKPDVSVPLTQTLNRFLTSGQKVPTPDAPAQGLSV